jgi:hypothetical protein
MKPNNRQNSEENEDEIDIGILIFFIFLTFPLRLEAIDSCLTLKIGFKY